MAKLNPRTIREAQERLKISRPTIYKLIADGALKTYKIGRRRFTADEYIDGCIEKLTAKAGGR